MIASKSGPIFYTKDLDLSRKPDELFMVIERGPNGDLEGGRVYWVFADGHTEGFAEGCVIINRYLALARLTESRILALDRHLTRAVEQNEALSTVSLLTPEEAERCKGGSP